MTGTGVDDHRTTKTRCRHPACCHPTFSVVRELTGGFFESDWLAKLPGICRHLARDPFRVSSQVARCYHSYEAIG